MKKIIILLLCCYCACACTDDKRYAPKEGRVAVFETLTPQQSQGTSRLEDTTRIEGWSSKMFNNQNRLPNAMVLEDEGSSWRRKVGNSIKLGSRTLPSPVVAEDALFVLDGTYTLTKLNLVDGAEIWQKTLAPEASGVGLTLGNNKLFAVSSKGIVTALTLDGDQIWQKDFQVPMRTFVQTDKNALYFVTAHNQLICLSQKDGKEIWRYQTTKTNTLLQDMAPPALSNGVLVAPFSTGEVIGFDVDSGSMMWIQVMVGSRPRDLVEVPQVVAAPVIEKGIVYLIGNANLAGAYDLKTGTNKWTHNLGARVTPVLGANAIFIITNDNELVSLDKKTGKIFWRQTYVPEKGKAWQSLTAQNSLLVLEDGEQMIFVNPASGEQVVAREIDTKTQPIVVNNRTIIVNEKTKVSYQ